MNRSICLPVHLVALIRRIVNVISTISITNHYVLSPDTRLFGWRLSRSTDSTPPDAPSAPDKPRSQPSRRNEDTIQRLMNNPTLFDPARVPRYPIVLCHGLYGFDVRGPEAFPSLRRHYWSSVLSILKHKLGAEVIVTGVPATGSIVSRAESLDVILQLKARGRGVNLMAHSMGGLDCRHLISHIRPADPFMDWCAQYLGLGRRQRDANNTEQQTQPEPALTDSNALSEKRDMAFRLSTLPSSFTTLLLSLFDSPAYACLTTSYLKDVFNPSTPDDPRVKYFSVASRTDEMNILHPLWFPKIVLDDAEKKERERLKTAAGDAPYNSAVPIWEREDQWGNDGLVTVQSARWGEFLGIVDGCDHWEIRGARGLDLNVELPSGIGNFTESWALGDWPKFIRAWKKQEKGASEGLELAQSAGIVSSETGETGRITQDGRNDPVVKASTDKLSTVFDWIVDHVPASGNPSLPEELLHKSTEINDLPTKFDLERFYVALTRKLYEEGL